jgi:TetR/AcrR family transcriptional regulator, cholesterol catabolism regulator
MCPDKLQYNEPDPEISVSQRIISRARHHFFAYGFRGVTMDDLAAELGMSKKTLYAHFPSKKALLEAVVFDKFRSVEADLDRIAAEHSSDFTASIRTLLTCMQRHTEELQPPYIRDVQKTPELFEVVRTRRRQIIQKYFGRLLEEGQQAGAIRKDIPAWLITEIVLGVIEAIVNPSKIGELGLSPTTALSAILKIILEGVTTETGRSGL